jgi:hypothetical protein
MIFHIILNQCQLILNQLNLILFIKNYHIMFDPFLKYHQLCHKIHEYEFSCIHQQYKYIVLNFLCLIQLNYLKQLVLFF